MPTLPARLPTTFTSFSKVENALFSLHLDELFNLWNNAGHPMNYWVHIPGTYRSTTLLEKVHKAFFSYYQFNAMAKMPDETVLVRMVTALDLDFERALHYHHEGYQSNNNSGLLPCITRPSTSTLCSQQRPASTQLTIQQPKASSCLSLQDIPEACHSEKGLLVTNFQ